MQVKIGIRFHFAEITYFEKNRLNVTSSRSYATEFTFGKSSSIKKTFYQKLRYLKANTSSFIPHVCYFPYHPSIAASENWSLTTLLPTQMRGEETQSQ